MSENGVDGRSLRWLLLENPPDEVLTDAGQRVRGTRSGLWRFCAPPPPPIHPHREAFPCTARRSEFQETRCQPMCHGSEQHPHFRCTPIPPQSREECMPECRTLLFWRPACGRPSQSPSASAPPTLHSTMDAPTPSPMRMFSALMSL